MRTFFLMTNKEPIEPTSKVFESNSSDPVEEDMKDQVRFNDEDACISTRLLWLSRNAINTYLVLTGWMNGSIVIGDKEVVEIEVVTSFEVTESNKCYRSSR